jgi:very-short-patch-repair endonuclease
MTMNPTKAEAALEPAIAELGEPYRFQYPFLDIKYFADFALLESRIIIEVDGDSHDRPAQMEKDLIHEIQVLEKGWSVVRLTNEEAIKSPAESVARALSSPVLSLDKSARVAQLKAQLAQLHQSYPGLLAAAAKKSKFRKQRAKVGADTRATQRKRAAQLQA